MQQVLLVGGMEQFVLTNHASQPLLRLIIRLIHNVELISLDAQLLPQDKDVLQLLHVNLILLLGNVFQIQLELPAIGMLLLVHALLDHVKTPHQTQLTVILIWLDAHLMQLNAKLRSAKILLWLLMPYVQLLYQHVHQMELIVSLEVHVRKPHLQLHV